MSCRFRNSISTTCCRLVADIFTCQDSLPCRQRVRNKLATSRYRGKRQENVSNGFWALTFVVCWRTVKWFFTATCTVTVVIKTFSSTAVRTARTPSVDYRSESFPTCCLATLRTCSAIRRVAFTCRRTRKAPDVLWSGTWAYRTATR